MTHNPTPLNHHRSNERQAIRPVSMPSTGGVSANMLLAALTAAMLLAVATAGPAAGSAVIHRHLTAHQSGAAAAAVFVPIAGELDGRTGPQLLNDSFVFSYQQPATTPLTDCPRLGRHGRVRWVTNPVSTCRLRSGEPVVVLPGASCSDVEQPPFFAVGEAAQRSCAQEFNAAILSLTVAVDGGPAVDIIDVAFAVSPPQQTVAIPADNAGGLPAGTATFTAAGWAAVLRPLPPGTHTLHVTGTLDGLDQPIEETFTLIVTAHRGRP
jgi:hypothetical protein